MSQTLFNRALRNPYTRASFRTIAKHEARGAFDQESALRLLRNNVRDVQPTATIETRQAIAERLLQFYLANRTA